MSRSNNNYQSQDRGGRSEYEAYFAGMDKSMQQKVALTTAHFPTRGKIVDMGSGSGRGTYDLACLYAGLEMAGVDINPKSVALSREQFRRNNLNYVVGDISKKVFPDESLDGILDSSVLHHVTSFNDFDVKRVMTTLDNQVAQLKPSGVLIIRDFVAPDGPATVHLDLPDTDGSEDGTVEELSTAALFERFAAQWRSSMNRTGPVPYKRLPSPRDGFTRFQVSLRSAAEFILRKDYRADWDVEVLEEYTYLDQAGFENAFHSRGLRIVTSMPIWNPWIVEHRFEGKFHLHDTAGAPLPFPPTNYLIVGEKVAAGGGVQIVEHDSRVLDSPRFLKLRGYRHRETGYIYELAERPNETIDVLPWYEVNGQTFVLAKKDFPRPIVNALPEQPSLNRSRLSGYITEPISALIPPSADHDQAVRDVLRERAAVQPDEIVYMDAPSVYYTSPGGINERVAARRIQIRPREPGSVSLPNYTPFLEAGTIRELDAGQALRASQVGGMFDARLEINVYLLLRNRKRSAGPWIGAAVNLAVQDYRIHEDPAAITPLHNAGFDPCDLPGGPRFLSLLEGNFVEHGSGGEMSKQASFEYVVPAQLSKNTASALPVLRNAMGTFIGIEHRDLPAVQSFTGSSRIAAAPAWRLGRDVQHRTDLPEFVGMVLPRDFRVQASRIHELGGPYFTSPGVTPEIVHPFVVEIDGASVDDPPLHFIEAHSLLSRIDQIQDAHLLISSFRLLHALNML